MNSKHDALFHRVAYEYSRVDWDGLRDHFRDASLNSVLLLQLVNFVSGFRPEYISLIVSIRSDLPHLHGFQQFVLLP